MESPQHRMQEHLEEQSASSGARRGHRSQQDALLAASCSQQGSPPAPTAPSRAFAPTQGQTMARPRSTTALQCPQCHLGTGCGPGSWPSVSEGEGLGCSPSPEHQASNGLSRAPLAQPSALQTPGMCHLHLQGLKTAHPPLFIEEWVRKASTGRPWGQVNGELGMWCWPARSCFGRRNSEEEL